ncbi:aldo/keto reductase [Paenibacillus massiliensis]|uniref:aldo/keto reductase n=1 Tax=Paenibacillus massiliensis TaxID=225917 RepID=UPI00036ACF25|nr:aldo/keto reductase [Paenibacillus massiliensis]
MHYRRLGHSGLQVSALGLGTNAFGKRADEESSIRIIHTALDAGIQFLDTANIYANTESERIIGLALQGRRHEAVLATKAGLPRGQGPNQAGSSRLHVQRELEDSLRRLKTDYVDLYQIHTFDPSTPLEETLRTLDDLISAGKIRYIGASNYAAWELMKALSISEQQRFARYISVQVSYSLADRTPERELMPLCLDQGIGIIPYFPLAGGILTGKYAQGQVPSGSRADTDPNFSRFLSPDRIQLGTAVGTLAAELNTSPVALSLAWLMHQPAVSTVIVGATRPEQLLESLPSVDLSYSDDIAQRLENASSRYIHQEPFAVYRLPVE